MKCLPVLLAVLIVLAGSAAVRADEPVGPWALSVYFENDMFADTDQNYTNGLKFAWISPDVDEYRESGKLPDWADDAVARLPMINRRPVGYKRNIVLTLGQSIFTPQDILRRDLIRDDRPYAGWLYPSVAEIWPSGGHFKGIEVVQQFFLDGGVVVHGQHELSLGAN